MNMEATATENVATPGLDNGHACSLCEDIEVIRHPNVSLNDPVAIRTFKHDLFHYVCSSCPSKKCRGHTDLCPICTHLRIHHLAACIPSPPDKLRISGWKPLEVGSLRIKFATTGEVLERQSGCAMCKVIVDTARVHYPPGLTGSSPEEPIHIFLEGYRIAVVYGHRQLLQLPLYKRTHDHSPHYQVGMGCPGQPGKLTPVDEKINWKTPLRWIAQDRLHREKKSRKTEWPEHLKLIDVDQDQIIDAPNPCEFMALSYVWGAVKEVDLPDWPSFNRAVLPATIKDVLVACNHLEQRYLWVDQLCIDQRDEKEKRARYDQTGCIYSNAVCTLVALAGEDSNYGLPGVTQPRLWSIVQQGNVAITIPQLYPYQSIERSQWNTRGWTFQEGQLSQRLLYFAEYEVLFFSPMLDNRQYKRECGSLGCYNPIGFCPIDGYSRALKSYKYRHLSNPADILRAWEAVSRLYFGCETYYGLRLGWMDEEILWYIYYDKCPRPGEVFPSWSWASQMPRALYEGCIVGLAVWAVPKEGGSSSDITLCQPASDRPLPLHSGVLEWYEAILVAWSKGCMRRPFPLDLTRPSPLGLGYNNETAEEVARLWNSYAEYWQYFFGDLDNDTTFTSEDRKVASSGHGRILVHSQTAKFNIEHILGSCKFDIYSKNGRWITMTELDKYMEPYLPSGQGEFIALSIANDLYYSIDHERARTLDGRLRLHRLENILGEPFLLNAMWIGRNLANPDVARRLTVVRIPLKHWVEARPRFETIVLE
ncbi:HET-domain-containing protein [Aspergillus sclerotioniger CBS 115572]|uniref:HET-domain-containing protein n=1 Tax=Aspergillus sclerotioniger CBS 115572 TaxID=1450535 RepID=A0A317VW03_9EURO|nr:HET-domain-containing protein [Aspergillus sclerotioniger CBS 115572]PWY76100.1 HET-domain-containing protein [Aspergillus sclerotioniger CBS 115572]